MLFTAGKETVLYENADGVLSHLLVDVILCVSDVTNSVIRYGFSEGKFYELEEHYSVSDWNSDITSFKAIDI